MIYFCAQQNRRNLVMKHPSLNGIDFIEVAIDKTLGNSQLQLTLLKDGSKLNLSAEQIKVSGGNANTQITINQILPPNNLNPRLYTLLVKGCGDFSTYSLKLTANPNTEDPPPGIDPQLAEVNFSFKAGCSTSGDCLNPAVCGPAQNSKPDINYLARDYNGFVQTMLDRMAVLNPGWGETHAADLGVALVELLAYTADHLSYQQDAIATEAYLGTARSRISLRRHARLVDYWLDEGANARAWVFIRPAKTAPDPLSIPAKTYLFPGLPGVPAAIAPDSRLAAQLMDGSQLGFATLQNSLLYQEQNEMHFYTWSDTNCCLLKGSTQATLADNYSSLQVGSVLIFEEILGSTSGLPEDANPAHRWAVRLTKVQTKDYLNQPLIDPLSDPLKPQFLTLIQWDSTDALPFNLCISAQGKPNISVARGNIVPADQGIWQDWEDLGTVPTTVAVNTDCSCTNNGAPTATAKLRYFPRIAKSPLTFARSYDSKEAAKPATAFLQSDTVPQPQLHLKDDKNRIWSVLKELLSSNAAQTVAVAEIERDNSVFVRFGNGEYGMQPSEGTQFFAQYRTGNGSIGNLGRDALGHVLSNAAIAEVRNPLPAAGGRDPESMEHIRQHAPTAFMQQLRAVNEDDYGLMAAQNPAVAQARASLRWTGAWHTAFVSINPSSGQTANQTLLSEVNDLLDCYRLAGVDLQVEAAVIVGLHIGISICVSPEHFQSHVRDALLQRFTSGYQPDGSPGLLNPQNFNFGQTLYTSPFIATAQSVDGVISATMTLFERLDNPLSNVSSQGYLTLGRLELARCDNNPDRQDYGIFELYMDGGK